MNRHRLASTLFGLGCSVLACSEAPSQDTTLEFRSAHDRPTVDGKPHGTWQYFYATGELWQTVEFSDGKRHGEDVTFFRTGAVFREGIWTDGIRDGTWQHKSADGEVLGVSELTDGSGVYTAWHYDGLKILQEALRSGVRHGAFSSWYHGSGAPNVVATYADGELDGLYRRFYETPRDQIAEEIEYRAGLRHGRWVLYHANGGVKERGTFMNDLAEGLFVGFHENQQKRHEGQLKQGKRDAVWTEWYSNGQKRLEGPYLDGLRHTDAAGTDDFQYWYDSGQLQLKTGFFENEYHGRLQVWHRNGQKSRETQYSYGVREGRDRRWNEQGELTFDGTYVNGELDGWAESTNAEGVKKRCRFEGGEMVECE